MKGKIVKSKIDLKFLDGTIIVKGVPCYYSKEVKDYVIDSNLIEFEKAVAREVIINNRICLTGIEIKFIRKVFGYSLQAFANKFGLSNVAIKKWEDKGAVAIGMANEIMVRSFFIQKLGLPPKKFDDLYSITSGPNKVVIEYKNIKN